MKRFAVYDETTGQILRFGACSDSSFDNQAINPNERVLEIPKGMEVVHEEYFDVKEGKIIHNPAKEKAVKSAQTAARQKGKEQEEARKRILQDVIDKKGSIDERLANVAKVLNGEI